MAFVIRQASAEDASQWVQLLKSSMGEEYPIKQVYDPAWTAEQLDPATGSETWVAEASGEFEAAVSILRPFSDHPNPVLNLGRNLFRPDSFSNGAAEALLRKLTELADERNQTAVARVLVSDNAQQILFENLGYTCAGYQPFKHQHRVREAALFYVHVGRQVLVTRVAVSESLSQINELAGIVLGSLNIPSLMTVRDGVTGYPLQTELKIHDATYEDYELWRAQSQPANPPIEISSGYNLGLGLLRVSTDSPLRAILGQREDQIVAGVAYCVDDHDRCLRIVDSFSADDLSTGTLFRCAVQIAQEQLSAVYVETDILMTAPRLLKSAEQLGFVPIAYLPAFYFRNGQYADAVKLVKLNVVYSLESASFTAQARRVVDVIDHSFEDQKVGVAIINLLRSLPIFEGLGDGELRKIARLFTQKLYRPGERVFNKGDAGKEAFVVMRGQIDIHLEEQAKPVASIGNGQIFGEQTFLDGATRTATALASQASILLVVQRSAFNALVQREPHLGMVVTRNIAVELSNKLRHANAALGAPKK
ncbi:MAG: cyclic nucleotide-binding domain-containing protein [Limisphaerales bacterium]